MSPTPADDARIHLSYALHSVRDLRQYAHSDADIPALARNGCREAFYMNARLLAGFFVQQRDQRDWHARDFVPDWTAPEPLKSRLTRVWEVASQHVAHLSKQRTLETPTPPEDVSLSGLTDIAADCYRVAAAFVAAYRQTPDAENVAIWEGYLRGHETETWITDWITLPPDM